MFGRARKDGNQETARLAMVEHQVRARGIRDPQVLEAMRRIPRHEFVPQDLRGRSYEDCPLPIGLGQTISQPYIVARMSELLELEGHERVLEVGAGCGYQSAVLSLLATEVCALELEPDLVTAARATLERLDIHNVDLRQGDGFTPWPDSGRFEGIICACAPAEVPEALLRQLAPGGRLVIPVGPSGNQVLRRISLGPDGCLHEFSDGPVRFVPMRHPPLS